VSAVTFLIWEEVAGWVTSIRAWNIYKRGGRGRKKHD